MNQPNNKQPKLVIILLAYHLNCGVLEQMIRSRDASQSDWNSEVHTENLRSFIFTTTGPPSLPVNQKLRRAKQRTMKGLLESELTEVWIKSVSTLQEKGFWHTKDRKSFNVHETFGRETLTRSPKPALVVPFDRCLHYVEVVMWINQNVNWFFNMKISHSED